MLTRAVAVVPSRAVAVLPSHTVAIVPSRAVVHAPARLADRWRRVIRKIEIRSRPVRQCGSVQSPFVECRR